MSMRVDAYELTGKALPLLRRFEAAHGSDKEAEARARKLGIRAALCGAGAFLSLFLGGLLAASFDTPLGFLLLPVFLVAMIVLLVKRSKVKKFDLDDRKLDAVTRVLRMLSVDIPPESDVGLRVDFRSYQEGGTKSDEQKSGTFGSVKSTKYTHPWLRLGGVLVDGTRYQLDVVDAVARKEKRKRKYTKVKERIHSSIQLQLRLRPDRYGSSEAVAQQLQGVAPPRPLQLKAVRATGPKLEAVLQTPLYSNVKGRYQPAEQGKENLVTADMLLQTMLWAYDGIGRSLAKSA
jgi:hypothetical protein